MMGSILVGIDGTGAAFSPGAGRDRAYDRNFNNSFVRVICNRHSGWDRYFRGPVALGGGLTAAVQDGYKFAKDQYDCVGPKFKKVLLVGYSRGAAGVVAVAAKLAKEEIPVEAVMLFDCVDRHVVIDAEVIPRNVANVLHVIRDPRSKSRESFSNDGLIYYPASTKYRLVKYNCTHGGMGGMPWTLGKDDKPTDIIDEGGVDGETTITYLEDTRVSDRVWSGCQPFLNRHGFI